MMKIYAVLATWARQWKQAIQEAIVFYYRLLTNSMGLPRWLWAVTLVSFLLSLIMWAAR